MYLYIQNLADIIVIIDTLLIIINLFTKQKLKAFTEFENKLTKKKMFLVTIMSFLLLLDSSSIFSQ